MKTSPVCRNASRCNPTLAIDAMSAIYSRAIKYRVDYPFISVHGVKENLSNYYHPLRR